MTLRPRIVSSPQGMIPTPRHLTMTPPRNAGGRRSHLQVYFRILYLSMPQKAYVKPVIHTNAKSIPHTCKIRMTGKLTFLLANFLARRANRNGLAQLKRNLTGLKRNLTGLNPSSDGVPPPEEGDWYLAHSGGRWHAVAQLQWGRYTVENVHSSDTESFGAPLSHSLCPTPHPLGSARKTAPWPGGRLCFPRRQRPPGCSIEGGPLESPAGRPGR